MDGFGADAQRRIHDRVPTEVALRRWRRAQVNGFVGFPDVERPGVGV